AGPAGKSPCFPGRSCRCSTSSRACELQRTRFLAVYAPRIRGLQTALTSSPDPPQLCRLHRLVAARGLRINARLGLRRRWPDKIGLEHASVARFVIHEKVVPGNGLGRECPPNLAPPHTGAVPESG